jgi:hypothetical protein
MNLTSARDVRIAGPADREEVYRLFRAAHGESGIVPFDLDRVDVWVDRMLYPEQIPDWDTGPRGVIGVIGEPYALEAVAFLIIGCIWYASQRHLEELVIYVQPQDRPKGHLRALVDWMKEQSILTGLPLMSGVMTTHRTEAKVRLYKSLIPQVGAVFRFDPITACSSRSLMVH